MTAVAMRCQNPVLVSPSGAWAVDLRIHVAPAQPEPDDGLFRRL